MPSRVVIEPYNDDAVPAIRPCGSMASADQPGDKLANAIRQNVRDVAAKLKSATPILSAAASDGKIKIVGGIYRLASGKVELVE